MILHELQQVLSKMGFTTIEAFILLCNDRQPETYGQTRVCFEIFVENLEAR